MTWLSMPSADINEPQLVTSVKQHGDPPFGPSTDLTDYHFEFPFNLIGKGQWLFNRPIIAHTQIQVHRWGPE